MTRWGDSLRRAAAMGEWRRRVRIMRAKFHKPRQSLRGNPTHDVRRPCMGTCRPRRGGRAGPRRRIPEHAPGRAAATCLVAIYLPGWMKAG
jgi:hypothetical protein